MVKVRLREGRRRKLPPVPKPGRVKVGFPAGQAEGGVIDIAIWNHFGTETIPERPFLDNAMRDNRGKYRAGMATAARSILRGETGVDTVLSKLGIMAQGDVQEEITTLSAPPNAPATIKAKGSSNPLIDTGRMRQAVTYRVEKK